MRFFWTASLLIVLTCAFATPGTAQTQTRRPEAAASLEEEVERLARQIDRLERLVQQLQVGGTDARPGAEYGLVAKGMSRREVVALLGEPLEIRGNTFWYPPSRPGGLRFWVNFSYGTNSTVTGTSYDR